MKPNLFTCFFVILLISFSTAYAQQNVDLSEFSNVSGAIVEEAEGIFVVSWPAGKNGVKGVLKLDMKANSPLLSSIQLTDSKGNHEISNDVDPLFLLAVGQRDLSKENGWDIFFDRRAYNPYKTFKISLEKENITVKSKGKRAIIQVNSINAGNVDGWLEIILYHGSPLLNMAAVISTEEDAKAIIYDAGLVSDSKVWNEIFWYDTEGYLQSSLTTETDRKSENLAVKYRTIIGESIAGSLAISPPPHQYFHPLDNAYNLKYVWYGEDYRELVDGYGIGIRQDLMGDNRHVPWFNAPPKTDQRLNFFVLLSASKDGQVLEDVKAYTHDDQYKPLDGYRTMVSHFHTEHMDDIDSYAFTKSSWPCKSPEKHGREYYAFGRIPSCWKST